ncbi:hypothetical protein GCM10022268_00460 [Sphingomonas cynarae]|uniref:Transcriptional regulator n=1 Tax=Sphingomonas cynarae TaxID=930197 RepID=A0ABP7CT22_9SPHN
MDDERRRHLEAKLLEALALADAIEEYAVGAMLSATIMHLRTDRQDA